MSDLFSPLTSNADWTEALEQSDETPVLIYKHSATCPVSTKAQGEVEELAETEADLPVYQVVVQNHRAVSDQIEADLGVRHETPQVILLDAQDPVFDTSHFDVTADAIRNELQQSTTSTE